LFIHLRYSLSKKSIYLITLLVSLITLVALIVLSFLLTKESIKNNEEFARKSFFSKYDAIYFEFDKMSNYKKVIQNVVNKSNKDNYREHLGVLNDLNSQNDLKLYNWAFLNTSDKNSFDSLKLYSNAIDREISTSDNFFHNKLGKQNNSIIIRYKGNNYWTHYFFKKTSNLYYGYTFNLNDLHDYFVNINENTFNYAFVFDNKGYCITHPDEKFIGKNIFDFTTITPNDTITSNLKSGYTENKAISEYLTETEITRFIKPMKVNDFDGYVVVGHLNFLIEESVFPTKLYVAIIFLTTIILISFIFLLFNLITRKAYQENEIVIKDKNRLLIENEEVVKENALNQLKQLKNQINPHFLFNSLNTLYMIIGLDSKKAQRFTMNLSKIYRYLIVPPKENIVSVEKELDFISQYMELQKNRFHEELIFNLEIKDQKSLLKFIPYLALQLVVENCIKHNIATIENPLTINIRLETDYLIVNNTYQLKDIFEENAHFGLDYLKKMYDFYNTKSFKIEIKNGLFICTLPLINQ